MKKLIFSVALLGAVLSGNAQTVLERVTDKTCVCLQAFSDLQTMNDSLEACTTRALGQVVAEGLNGETVDLSLTGMNDMVTKVAGMLFDNCWKVRMLVVDDMVNENYKVSDNPKATEFYDAGNLMMKSGDYNRAIGAYEKALKADPRFIFALDHTAICYRRLEQYDKAIKYYKKSLDIFPQGHIALMNMAVCYKLLNKYPEAAECYDKLMFYQPMSGEGYFGMAGLQFDSQLYADALHNYFNALHLYSNAGNEEYKNDAVQMINRVFSEMDKLGQKEEFMRIAAEHNVNVNEKPAEGGTQEDKSSEETQE